MVQWHVPHEVSVFSKPDAMKKLNDSNIVPPTPSFTIDQSRELQCVQYSGIYNGICIIPHYWMLVATP